MYMYSLPTHIFTQKKQVTERTDILDGGDADEDDTDWCVYYKHMFVFVCRTWVCLGWFLVFVVALTAGPPLL